MHAIRIIGIDAATKARSIGLACGDVVDGECKLLEARKAKKPVQKIAQWINDGPKTVLLAVDAPLGWPAELGKSLVDHRAGMSLGMPRKAANQLFRRHTDRMIKRRLGKQPLDIGADRIARTAHSILCRLHELAEHCTAGVELKMAWEPTPDGGCGLLEVYPAATLIALGASTRGYKKNDDKGRSARQAIVETLHSELHIKCCRETMLDSDDVLDAAICVLAGFDFLQGRAIGPSSEEMTLAEKEGWIWCRRPDRARDHKA